MSASPSKTSPRTRIQSRATESTSCKCGLHRSFCKGVSLGVTSVGNLVLSIRQDKWEKKSQSSINAATVHLN